MKWVDPIVCDNCQSTCDGGESAEPDPYESARGAERVEKYTCVEEDCEGGARFPRYNNAFTLLETRTGRCGELGFACRWVVELISRGMGEPLLPGVACCRPSTLR